MFASTLFFSRHPLSPADGSPSAHGLLHVARPQCSGAQGHTRSQPLSPFAHMEGWPCDLVTLGETACTKVFVPACRATAACRRRSSGRCRWSYTSRTTDSAPQRRYHRALARARARAPTRRKLRVGSRPSLTSLRYPRCLFGAAALPGRSSGASCAAQKRPAALTANRVRARRRRGGGGGGGGPPAPQLHQQQQQRRQPPRAQGRRNPEDLRCLHRRLRVRPPGRPCSTRSQCCRSGSPGTGG